MFSACGWLQLWLRARCSRGARRTSAPPTRISHAMATGITTATIRAEGAVKRAPRRSTMRPMAPGCGRRHLVRVAAGEALPACRSPRDTGRRRSAVTRMARLHGGTLHPLRCGEVRTPRPLSRRAGRQWRRATDSQPAAAFSGPPRCWKPPQEELAGQRAAPLVECPHR
jgi:hypothetical protein